MVDPLKGLGNVHNLSRPSHVQRTEREDEVKKKAEAKDEVVISGEALDLSQAEEASRAVRQQLQDDPNAKLGLNPNFDEKV